MACCCVVTSTGTVKMVESCGKFSHIARPGLEMITPCVQSVSGTISMRLQQMEVSCETKSKDNVFLSLKVSIQYQVINEDNKIIDAHYRLTNPRVQVQAANRTRGGGRDEAGAEWPRRHTPTGCARAPSRARGGGQRRPPRR